MSSCLTSSATVTCRNDTAILHQCLSTHDAVGLAVVAESAFLSLVAVTLVLALISRNVWQKSLFPRTPVARQHLIQVPADLFMLSLFIADWIHALGGVMNIKWVHDEKVSQGRFCNAQGAIQLLGEPVVALVTLVITIHTFSSVWWGRGVRSLLTASIIIGIVWLFVALYVAIGLGLNINKSFMTPTFWCWIGPTYMPEKITGEYLWLWLTLGFSFVFYVLLFFWSRGHVTVDQHKWWKFSVHRCKDSLEDSGCRRHSLKLVAYKFIAYPITYCVVVIPVSVVRFIEFSRGNTTSTIPHGVVYFAESIFRLSGVLNVLLFVLTRRGILLFGGGPNTGQRLKLSDDILDGGRVESAQPYSGKTSESGCGRVVVVTSG